MNKKLKILFGISLVIILVFFMEIHLFANGLPSKNASFTELMNFAKGHMEVTDNLWKDVDEDLAQSWYNTTKKQEEPNNGSGVAVSKTKSFYKKLYENKVNERKELQQKVTETEDTLADFATAYKTIPAQNASESEINTFIKSDAENNDLKNLKKVDQSKLEKWKETLERAREDNPELKKNYTEAIDTLEDCIGYKKGEKEWEEVENHKTALSNQLKEAKSATETTLNEYKKKLMLAKMDEGNNRADVKFDDVLDDVTVFTPGEISSGDAKKMETKISMVLTVISNIGIAVSVIMLAIIGVKYMLGSIEEKAEYKKDMIPYVVGAVLLFSITTIVKIVQAIGEKINGI